MVDNLGIYNSHVNSDYDINKHIEQGVQFKQYGNKIYPANEHILLQESSSNEWGSVADAYNGDDSVKKRGLIEGMTMSENQIQFNNLVSQYATDYKTYISTFLTQSPPSNYNDLGCWMATFPQDLKEQKDMTYDNNPDACYQRAKSQGHSVFALQNSGACFIADQGQDAKKHGKPPGTNCPPGGGWYVNHVFSINTNAETLKENYNRDRKAAEDALLIQKNNIMTLASQLNIDTDLSVSSLINLTDMSRDAKIQMQSKTNDVNEYRENQEEYERNYDNDSVDGALEYSALRMNSNYYHVFVYLLVAATLFGFIFNLMVNPDANVLNAIYVLGALFVVYFISRYYTV
jgi:hypothetical protein